MGLTNDENRRLHELGDRLSSDDPGLAAQLSASGMVNAARIRRRRASACVIGLTVSVILTPISVFFGVTVLIGIGATAFIVALIGLALL